MPIRVKCKCGKSFGLKDEYAGKKIRCPACKEPIKVPAAGDSGAPAAPQQQAPAAPQPTPQAGGVSGLFEEEGIGQIQGPICPACHKEMKPGTVLCMECGYNAQIGQRIQGHSAAQEEASEHGNEVLDQAAEHMRRDARTQKQISGQGAPWWLYVGILAFLIVGSTAGVMASAALSGTLDGEGEGGGPNPALKLILIMIGLVLLAIGLVNLYHWAIIITHAFRNSVGKGVCCLLIPFYILIYGYTHDEVKGNATAMIICTVASTGVQIVMQVAISMFG